MSKRDLQFVGVRNEPEADGFGPDAIEWHIASDGGEYATACGLDGDDPMAGQHGTVERMNRERINCQQCRRQWRFFKSLTLRESDFDQRS